MKKMKASETKLVKLLEGTQQYVVPLFQRPYKWEKKHWDELWNDLMELYEDEQQGEVDWNHFIGSMVTMPTVSVPEGIAKYMLIDGQQRLTTLFILLILIRDRAKNSTDQKNLSDKINELYLINKFSQGNDYYKLMPTQVDRVAYQNLVKSQISTDEDDKIVQAYRFYERRMNATPIQLEILEKVITNRLMAVSIVLDKDDNPYLVFESLNAKGEPLGQADLIRNHFFMKCPVVMQEEVYKDLWLPMQTSLMDNLTTFIRHFLVKEGMSVKENAVYMVLKRQTGDMNTEEILDYLKTLVRYSGYYSKIMDPAKEVEPLIARGLRRLKRIDVRTVNPFLLNCYESYHKSALSVEEFAQIISIIENFIIRRYICGVPTNQLNKIFPGLYTQAIKNENGILEAIKDILQNRNYPVDEKLHQQLQLLAIYGGGDRLNRAKFILETLEETHGHKEAVDADNLTIEHVMPQTISHWWREHLGVDADIVHELYLHTLGNLTLTAYNAEMYNHPYPEKQARLEESHLELNKYFKTVENWDKEAIETRAEFLADIALKAWPYFGSKSRAESNIATITGFKPVKLIIMGQEFSVETWRDVLEKTLNTIYELDPDILDIIASKYPRFIDTSKERLRSYRQLKNGKFVEMNLSAQNIKQFCLQAIETADLSSDDWQVEVNAG
jgi:uncharacterized protein with ParB-like and HNH nuclease domain